MLKFKPNLALPPPTVLVLVSIASTQLGSAFAKNIIQELGSITTVLLRVGLGAIVLLLIQRQRPQLKGYTRSDYLVLILFGLGMAAMNLSFYGAIARIPLGVAVTIEFVGPLGVACANSRRILDLLWIFLAGVGIFLLAPVAGSSLDPIGVGLALLAAFFWGTYILLSARVGKIFTGINGIALMATALAIGTIGLLPLGIVSQSFTIEPKFLAAGLAVAILSSAIPYTFELEALKKLPVRVFGVLMSLEPAIATLLGFIILGETLELRAIVAVALVTLASVGASVFEKR